LSNSAQAEKTKIMKKEISNRVNMINANITYCDANPSPTAGIVAFTVVFLAVKAKMILINSFNQIGEGTTTGVTLDTNVLRKTMTVLGLKCGNAVLAYANSINNNTLAALVNFSESKLNGMKKEDVDDVCQAIHDATAANIAGAGSFGVVASDVTDLQAAIDIYRVASQNPRQAIITKSQAKKQVGVMVKEVIDNLLAGQMDKMVNTLKASNLDFWNGYRQSREIIDLGSTTAKVRGKVLDVLDVPLKNVLFRIFETGTQHVVKEVSTDVKGRFNAAQLPSGNFDFEWKLGGYKTVREENVHISAGKELKRTVVMRGVVVREGNLQQGMFVNIDTSGLDSSNVVSVVIEATGSGMRFYATASPGNGNGGGGLDVTAGSSVTKSASDFEAAVGAGNGNDFLNVQNVGMMVGHWRIEFDLS